MVIGHRIFVQPQSRSTSTPKVQAAVDLLLLHVWGFEVHETHSSNQIAALCNHYRQLLRDTTLLGRDISTLREENPPSKSICKFLEDFKPLRNKTLSEIRDTVRQNPPAWLITPSNDNKLNKIIRWTCRLWLFTDLDTSIPGNTISQCIASALPEKGNPQFDLLSDDFSAKSLTRRGGFSLLWTSDLSEHLSFEKSSRPRPALKIFRHASLLRRYQKQADTENLYPEDFLDETLRTLFLLFPYTDPKAKPRIDRIQRKSEVDLEASMGKLDSFNLMSYRYYHRRLAEIQKRYDRAVPRRPKQWWFDRRKRVEWATLVVAIVVFVLTVVFGVIQSVTGILQVANQKG